MCAFHPGLELWRRYMALCCLPELGPKQAHAVVGAWPSLGALLAAYQDPARYASSPGYLCGV